MLRLRLLRGLGCDRVDRLLRFSRSSSLHFSYRVGGALLTGLLFLTGLYGGRSCRMYFFKCPCRISSSILSRRVWHSSVVCPIVRWYWQCLLPSASGGGGFFLTTGSESVLKASCRILALGTTSGVYVVNLGGFLSLGRAGTLFGRGTVGFGSAASSFSLFFTLNSCISYICINLAARSLISSIVFGFLRLILSAKTPSWSPYEK